MLNKRILLNGGAIGQIVEEGKYPNCYKIIDMNGGIKPIFQNMIKSGHFCQKCGKIVYESESTLLWKETLNPVHVRCLTNEERKNDVITEHPLIGMGVEHLNHRGKIVGKGIAPNSFFIRWNNGQKGWTNIEKHSINITAINIPTDKELDAAENKRYNDLNDIERVERGENIGRDIVYRGEDGKPMFHFEFDDDPTMYGYDGDGW